MSNNENKDISENEIKNESEGYGDIEFNNLQNEIDTKNKLVYLNKYEYYKKNIKIILLKYILILFSVILFLSIVFAFGFINIIQLILSILISIIILCVICYLNNKFIFNKKININI